MYSCAVAVEVDEMGLFLTLVLSISVQPKISALDKSHDRHLHTLIP